MKTIHLLRHAKSSWKSTSLTDMERPLNSRGKASCKIMASKLSPVLASQLPILCSPAVRAQSTIRRILKHAKLNQKYQVKSLLYTFDSQDLINFIIALDDDLDEILLVGHNPALTDLITQFTNNQLGNFPTCAYACLTTDSIKQWQLATNSMWQLVNYHFPKQFSQHLKNKM